MFDRDTAGKFYYRERAREEFVLAGLCREQSAALVHLRLAREYEKRSTQVDGVTMLQRSKPQQPRKPLIERAFELARSGRFSTVGQIENAMGDEGYAKQSSHWNSASLRKQLRQVCRQGSVVAP